MGLHKVLTGVGDCVSTRNISLEKYKKAKNLGTPDSWDIFKKKKNEVKKLLDMAKENYVKNKLDELEGNPRQFWRTINEMSGIGKNKSSRKCTKVVDENGNIYENLEAANFLNDYYVNIGPSLAKKHKKEWKKKVQFIRTPLSRLNGLRKEKFVN